MNYEDMPPVHSPADLTRHWQTLMGDPGFSAPQLWMILFDADGRPTPVVQKIEDIPATPEPAVLDSLMTVCRSLFDEVIPGGSVAFLRARPGPDGVTDSDRAWASGLSAAADQRGVTSHPVHLANDHEIRAA